ncbi:hypothetical protein [Mycolicibacterium goodii]|uniref:hypothetical protein n=1 Tax=Mycolicibacterium goodii TaxID=134601 RepID=UPI001BDC7732|nr:hypothetical protein [Mycolicibacterium goodii]MBU8834165.1 hypothetical protein [Mycolicibacterium goodii]
MKNLLGAAIPTDITKLAERTVTALEAAIPALERIADALENRTHPGPTGDVDRTYREATA